MIRAWLVAAVLVLALSGPAAADPIFTPLFISLGVTGSFTIAGTVITYASILSGIATALVTTAIGLLFAPKPDVPKPEDGKQPKKGTLLPRAYGGGRTRWAGAYALDEVLQNNLFNVYAMIGHRVSAFITPYLNDTPVEIGWGVPHDEGPDDTTVYDTQEEAPPGAIYGVVRKRPDGSYASNRVLLDFRLGLDTETPYTKLIEKASALEGAPSSTTSSIWTSDHRGDGAASASLFAKSIDRKKFSAQYPNPNMALSWIMDLAPMWDPRDEDQDPEDPETWGYAPRNFAINMIWFLCFCEYGRQLDYTRAILPVLDDWIEQIDICDEWVDLKEGGQERRYNIGWVATTDNDPRIVQKELLKTADAWMCERPDGTVLLRVGKYAAPTVTVTDADIVGYVRQSGVKDSESINELMVAYTSPDHHYTLAEIGPVVDEADQAARGTKRGERMEVSWAQSAGLASRLVKREIIRNQEPHRGKLFLKLWSRNSINACFERYFAVGTSALAPRLSGVVLENRGARMSIMKGTIEIDYVSSGPHIDVYDEMVDEFDAPPVVSIPEDDGLPQIADVNVVVEATINGDQNSAYLAVSFDDPEREDIGYAVYWRLQDDGTANPGEWNVFEVFDPPAAVSGRITIRTGTVPMGTVLEVYVAALGANGSDGPPSEPLVEVNTDIADSLGDGSEDWLGDGAGGDVLGDA